MTNRIAQVPRTGEAQLNERPGLLERHPAARFYATEKLDGFSFSFGRVEGAFIATSRDWMVDRNNPTVFARAVREMDLDEIKLPEGWVIQAELCGPGIRGNKLDLSGLQLFVFDIITPDGPLRLDAVIDFCNRVGLQTVPVLARNASLSDKLMVALAGGNSSLNRETEREGAVFRDEDGTSDPVYGRISFKVFNPAFPHIA